MFDDWSIYIYNPKEKKFYEIEDQYCRKVLFFTNQVNYVLCCPDKIVE